MVLSIKILMVLVLFFFTSAARASALVAVSDNETISSDGVGIHALSSDVTSKNTTVGSNVTITVSSTDIGGDNAVAGLYAHGEGASIDAADSLKIEIDGVNAYGTLADEGGVVEIGASADISASGKGSVGAFARQGSSMDIGSEAAIAASGEDSYGAIADGNSIMTIGSLANITTTGQGSYGAMVGENSSMTIGSSADITTSGNLAGGLAAHEGSRISAGDSVTITTSGVAAYGINSYASSSADIGDNLTINTSGEEAHGIEIIRDSNVDIGDSAVIVASGSRSSGARAWDSSSLNVGDSATIITSGDNAPALYSWQGSSVDIGGMADISTSGDYSSGADAQDDSSITIGVSADITTSGDSSHGVYTANSASIDIGDYLRAATSGASSRGVKAAASSSIKVGASAEISTTGQGSSGVSASVSSDISVGDSVVIATTGMDADGIIAQDNSRVTIGNLATIATSGDAAIAAEVSGDSSIKMGASTDISTSGQGSPGVSATISSDISVGDSVVIATMGTDADGITAHDNSSASVGNLATIATSGADSSGVETAGNSRVEIGASIDITTLGKDSSGVEAWEGSSINIGDSATITTSGDSAPALYVWLDSSIDIGGMADISTSGNYSSGADAQDDSRITIGVLADITTTGNNAHAVYANDKSQIRLSGAKISATGAGASAVRAYRDGRVMGSGLFDITGDMLAADLGLSHASINLNMTDGSRFTGATLLSGDNAEINLAMGGAASKWNVINDSALTSLELNGSTVDFTGSALGTTITTDTLDGVGGALIMKTDIGGGVSDKLVVTGTSSGSHTITAVNNASSVTDGTETLTLVETADSGATFALEHDVELGAWVYSLRQIPAGAGNVFQIYGAGPAGAPLSGEAGTLQFYSTGLSNAASAAVNAFASGYVTGQAETSALVQRLGELRDTPYMSGFWARVYGGEFNVDGMRHGREFDLEYGGVQIGYDRKIETGLPGDIYAGVMFGYSNGDVGFAYAGGDGGVDSKTFGVYGTYKQDDGLYLDAVLKYQWMDYEFNTFDSAGAKVTANDVDTSGFGLSIEAGKRFELNNGWYVEPQAQLSYLKQDGGTFNMSNGLSLGLDGWTSLQGRLGARVGYDNGAHGFYAKVSWVNEFDGGFGFTGNGEPFADSFGDNWWVYGVGYVSKLNDRNSLYLDIERSSGGAFEQDWAIKAGWRIVL